MMFRQKCPCLRPVEEEVRVLDYRHSSLDQVPAEVFNFERTLEELYVDANNIRDLPRVNIIVSYLIKIKRMPAGIAQLVERRTLARESWLEYASGSSKSDIEWSL